MRRGRVTISALRRGAMIFVLLIGKTTSMRIYYLIVF